MNNLHRELAPVSDSAWEEIEAEARRTFILRAAARRVVDMPDPQGVEFSAIGTGHITAVDSPTEGVQAHQRIVQPVLELRVPFSVTRAAVDDVERGSQDSDWQAVKDAATQIATAEDLAVFQGVDGIAGIGPSSDNANIALPEDVRDYPSAIAQAISALRLTGVDGPYSLLLSAKIYTEIQETSDYGYPIREHIKRMMPDGRIVWAPAIEGALLVSERGGDFELLLGQDLSIGYLSHDDKEVQLYLQESFGFLVLTTEASVVLTD